MVSSSLGEGTVLRKVLITEVSLLGIGILEYEVTDEPSLMLVGDNLLRHQDDEFCRKPQEGTFLLSWKEGRGYM